MIRSAICGVGTALPKRVLTNADIEKIVDTSDEWIVQRTGIHQRYIADDSETTVSLGVEAAIRALTNAGRQADDIDLIIVATTTADHTFPAAATQIQHQLGIVKGFAFDMQAACSGFVYALTTADMYLRQGLAKCALIIGAETFSRLLDWQDRTTCVLFGDGAGAVVLEQHSSDGEGLQRGILAAKLRSDGQHKDKLYTDGGVSTTRTSGYVRMEGRDVFKYAVGMITDVVEDCFAQTGLTARDLDWFVPHQANKRIIDASARKLDIAPDKVVITVDKHGNTSAASVPLALGVAVEDERIQQGDLVMLEAMGSGFTWGAVLLRW